MQKHTCLNCSNHFSGNFCNQCGEKVYTEHDRSVPHLFEEAFHFFTHFEGKFFNTLKAIVLKPGKLSLDYCNGLRVKYFKPLSFFLMLVILYLLFPIFGGLNMRLHYYVEDNWYGGYAKAQTEMVMKKKNITEEELTEQYQHKSEKISKFLLFTIIPAIALVSWAVGYKKRKYYFDHFIFSTEVSSALLLFGFLIFPVLLSILLSTTLVPNLEDRWIAIIVISIFAFYVSRMSRKFFEFRWWYNIIYCTLLISFTMVFIEYVYKFILFYIVIHLV